VASKTILKTGLNSDCRATKKCQRRFLTVILQSY